MCFLTHENRQSILNRVYTHFVMNRQPAGRLSGPTCAYHGFDDHGRRVSCAIGIFDTEGRLGSEPLFNAGIRRIYLHYPGTLSAVFGTPDLGINDVQFLESVQGEHDIAVKHAANLDRDFDRDFRVELDHRLTRLAGEQSLNQPYATIHLTDI